MTPAEVISEVLDEIERPDLESMAQIRLQHSVYETHAVAFFDRDKVELDTAVVPNQSYLEIPRPSRFRKLACIQALNAAGEVVSDDFKEKGLKKQVTNYFGFIEPNTYRISGSVIRVDFASPCGEAISTIRVIYWEFPTYSITAGVITCDSWIMDQYPQPIVADLCLRLAGTTDDDSQFTKLRLMREEGRMHLFNNYPSDIPLE